jgi:uncharacterized protein YigE (DUF2233 family)
MFEGSEFTVCDPGRGKIELVLGPRRMPGLQQVLGTRAESVAFAMNAGMFDDAGQPIGLLVLGGHEVHPINRNKGGGNFHLLPNGVFLVRKDGRAEVTTSAAYSPSPDIAFATQSGPMLLVDGKLHPAFDVDGESRFVRNGVAIAADGRPRFVISLDAVSFGKMARFVRDSLHARNALYFDGAVSSLWSPADHRQDNVTDLGPLVVAFKADAASTPGP